jgi:hypothetical protein
MTIDCTTVLTNQPEEIISQWLSLIPGGRIADAAELKGVCTSKCAQTLYAEVCKLIFSS